MSTHVYTSQPRVETDWIPDGVCEAAGASGGVGRQLKTAAPSGGDTGWQKLPRADPRSQFEHHRLNYLLNKYHLN